MMRDLMPLTKSSPDSLISLSSQSRQLVRIAPIVASAYVKLSLTSLMVSFIVKVGAGSRSNYPPPRWPHTPKLKRFVYFFFLLVRRRELEADVVHSFLGLLPPACNIQGYAIDHDFAFVGRGFGVIAFVREQRSRIVFLLLVTHSFILLMITSLIAKRSMVGITVIRSFRPLRW